MNASFSIVVASGLFLSACGTRLVVGELPTDAPDGGGGSPSAEAGSAAPDSGLGVEAGVLGTGNDAGTAALPAWEWLNPRPDGNAVRALHGTGVNDVWLVGDQGTVDHYDGVTLAGAYRGDAADSYYTVWAGAPNDVWVGGASASGTTRVLHFDGKTWSTDFALDHVTTLDSIWGADGAHVWALADQTAIMWDGHAWQDGTGIAPWIPVSSCEPQCKMVGGVPMRGRDLWGASADDIWEVGDSGNIAHFDGSFWSFASDTLWKTAENTRPDDVMNPFGSENDYIGVWGSGHDDVWAVFVHDDVSTTTGAVGPCTAGFVHWDGAAWTVRATLPCDDQLSDPHAFATGHRVWGAGPNDVFASVIDGLGGEVRWDGTTWSAVPEAADDAEATTSFFSPAPGRIWEASSFDGIHRFDASQLGAPASSPAAFWPAVFPGMRAFFYDVSAGSDGEVWTAGAEDVGKLYRWTASGWAVVDGLPSGMTPSAVLVNGAKDAWVAAEYSAGAPPGKSPGVLAHWDGATFSVSEAPLINSMFARGAGDVFAVGPKGTITHWDGTRWTAIPWQGSEYFTGVGGTATDTWITGYALDPYQESTTSQIVLHVSGETLSTVFTRTCPCSTGRVGRVWASGPNDVWVTGEPGLHWDGTSWSDLQPGGDFALDAVWGFGPGEVWLTTHFDYGFDVENQSRLPGASLRKWDGTKFVADIAISPGLHAMTGDGERVWAVGANGATLRRDRDPVTVPQR